MPKRTYQPKKKRRQKKHGFLTRMADKGGAKIIKSRRRKDRKRLAV